jgi:hypothetical protein
MVVSQRDDLVRNQMLARVRQDRFRRRNASEDLSVNDSERRHPWVNVSSLAEARHLGFGNPLRRLPVAEPRVRRAVNAKGCRALMVSRRRHNNSSSSSSEAPRLPQSITASDRVSRKVGRSDNQKKRHRQGSNNLSQ